jgi:hypothetical protein
LLKKQGSRAGKPKNLGPNACWYRQPIVSIRCGKGRLPGGPWRDCMTFLEKAIGMIECCTKKTQPELGQRATACLEEII